MVAAAMKGEKYDPIWWLYYRFLKIQLYIEWGSTVFFAYQGSAGCFPGGAGGTTGKCWVIFRSWDVR